MGEPVLTPLGYTASLRWASNVDYGPMNRATLVRRIQKAARKAGKSWTQRRTSAGGKHEIWICGTTEVAIPRHREINEYTAEGIMKYLEAELGEEWWR